MNELQKKKITDLRNRGFGYLRIAKMLGLSPNTIKSFCRRNNLTGRGGNKAEAVVTEQRFCKMCGKALLAEPGRKARKFCSDSCRLAWWREHPEELKRKAFYHFSCAYCGSSFDSYGNRKRKYCSHPCYIKDRFGDGKKP